MPTFPEPPAVPSPAQAEEVNADSLVNLAHRMGISTSGKTREEISDEIFSKAGSQSKAADS
jgi:hypothetical protein